MIPPYTNPQAYAHANASRYLDWCWQLAESPFSPLDKLEFAIITAHTGMARAIEGFLATRNVTRAELAETLAVAGVLAPGHKALYIADLRRMWPDLEPPSYSQQSYRRTHKLPGLGYCKLSFGMALIDPLGSDTICLDTHICQLYAPGIPVGRIYGNVKHYESVEAQLLAEAAEIDLSPFAYQWAAWDWKRGKVDDHSFLWRDGPTSAQLPLFSSLEVT